MSERKLQNNSGLTGYPYLDKPWNSYYKEGAISLERPKRTVYKEVLANNFGYPHDLALEYFGTKINFDNFFKNIDKAAKAFAEYGVKKGDFVTICSAGNPETVYAFYALSKMGAVVNMMAPFFDKAGMIDRISDCESDILVVMDTFYDAVKDTIHKSRIKEVIVIPTLNSSPLRFVSKKYKLEGVNDERFWNDFIKDGKNHEIPDTAPYEKDMPLAMVYSSGTTGAAKGILLSNDSFQNSAQAYAYLHVDLSRQNKFYQIVPPWYSTGLSTSIHLPLTYGVSLFMDPRFEREIFVKNVIKHKPNYTVAPTSMYEGFLDKKLVGDSDLNHFRYPFEGGEPLKEELGEQIENVFREHGSSARLYLAYGQCECGAAVTTQTPGDEFTIGSSGVPIPGVIVNAFDDEHNKLPYNEKGEIYVNTPCSMTGYYRNPEANEEYFYIDEDGVKWNRTGDIGYVNENGEMFILGRANDYTMVDGNKVYNFDVENIVMSLPEINICDVLPKKNEDGSESLALHIVFEESFACELEAGNASLDDELDMIQDKIYEKSNDVNMVPTVFKVRKDFPYAGSGKRDIGALKAEVDGFIYLDNKYVKNHTKKLSLYR